MQIVDFSRDDEGGAAMHGVGRQKARRSTGTRRQVLRRWRQAAILAGEPFFTWTDENAIELNAEKRSVRGYLAGTGQSLCSPEQSPGPGTPGPPEGAEGEGWGGSLPEPAEGPRRLSRPPVDGIRPGKDEGWIGPDGQRTNGPVEA